MEGLSAYYSSSSSSDDSENDNDDKNKRTAHKQQEYRCGEVLPASAVGKQEDWLSSLHEKYAAVVSASSTATAPSSIVPQPLSAPAPTVEAAWKQVRASTSQQEQQQQSFSILASHLNDDCQK